MDNRHCNINMEMSFADGSIVSKGHVDFKGDSLDKIMFLASFANALELKLDATTLTLLRCAASAGSTMVKIPGTLHKEEEK
jgi:hypothetical protein